MFSVPVGVAALIGFGTSLSGVVGGLSAVTNGPDAVPASSPTARIKLDRAVVALASRQSSAGSVTGRGGSTGDASEPTTIGTGGGTETTGGSGGGSESGSGTQSGSTITAPTAPDVSLPGTDTSTGDTVNTVNNTVNDTVDNVVSGVDNTLNDTVDNTLNGLLGQ